MKLLNDLLHTDYGLMSIIVITITLGMAVFFIRMFLVKMSEPPKPNPAKAALAARKQHQASAH